VFARLKPGVTLEQAQAEMAGITGRLEREFPGTNQDMQLFRCARRWWETFVPRFSFCSEPWASC
jgi:hypothetical protein